MSDTLFVFCRTGFEPELVAELDERISSLIGQGRHALTAHDGHVLCTAVTDELMQQITSQLRFSDIAFARQWFVAVNSCHHLSTHDRVSGILDVLKSRPLNVVEIFVETPDTDELKRLSPLCRSIAPRLQSALDLDGRVDPAARVRAHVCFIATDQAYVGYSTIENSSPWSMGIPRLKLPATAPSRATLKLEEAWLILVKEDLSKVLRPGMRAVDLGAAPGGWTLALTRRGIFVTAIDNGVLSPSLRASDLVEHIRVDGFRYRPNQPVAWLVCDMVAQPIRIAQLIAQWAEEGRCQHALFNLKLPMKKRLSEVTRCLQEIRGRLTQHNIRHELTCKQLYHDRDEVTCYLRLFKKPSKSRRPVAVVGSMRPSVREDFLRKKRPATRPAKRKSKK